MARKWIIFDYQANPNYDIGNEVIYNIEQNIISHHYSGTYILVRDHIVTTASNIPTQVAFKNGTALNKCTTKIDETATDDAKGLDLVIPMFNLIEYSSNYSQTTGSLWFYLKDEKTSFNADIPNNNNITSSEHKATLL